MHAGEAARAAFAMYCAAESADNDADSAAGGADAAALQCVEAEYMRCVEAIESMARTGAASTASTADILDRQYAVSDLVPSSGSDSDEDAHMPPLRLVLASALSNAGRLRQRHGSMALAQQLYERAKRPGAGAPLASSEEDAAAYLGFASCAALNDAGVRRLGRVSEAAALYAQAVRDASSAIEAVRAAHDGGGDSDDVDAGDEQQRKEQGQAQDQDRDQEGAMTAEMRTRCMYR